jgi:hypothetical protein
VKKGLPGPQGAHIYISKLCFVVQHHNQASCPRSY